MWRLLSLSSPFQISNHPACCVVSRGTGHTATGMRTRTTEVKIFDGGSILCRPGMRTQAENLTQIHVSVEDIAVRSQYSSSLISLGFSTLPSFSIRG